MSSESMTGLGTAPSVPVPGRLSGLCRMIIPMVSCCFLFLATCSSEPSELGSIPSVQLLEHEATVAVGDSLRLQLLPMLPSGYVPSVTWASSNPSTASVRSASALTGVVRGLSPGQAVILVSGKGARDSAVVIVSAPGGE